VDTGKQVRIMVVLMFLVLITIGAYTLWDPFRSESASQAQEEKQAEFGAKLFASNCRTCHGDSGEGGSAAGRLPAALPLNTARLQGRADPNDPTSPIDPASKAAMFKLVVDTITCGRIGTAMPTWGDSQGGPLNDTQIRQIATMIVDGRWDLAKAEAKKQDEELGATPEAPQNPTITDRSCGQVNRFGGGAAAVSPTPGPSEAPPDAQVVEITASNVLFDKTEIRVKPGKVFVRFLNKDNGVQHNFAVYTNESASTPLADGSVGAIVTGGPDVVATMLFEVKESDRGDHFFRCDVHPTIMTGRFIVE